MRSGRDGTALPFVPWDVEVARVNFGATCGPAAFAAVTLAATFFIRSTEPTDEPPYFWTISAIVYRLYHSADFVVIMN